MVQEDAKVSIILPTYNGARYIRRSIDSCLQQTYKNIELIIVDDGSTDETPRIIESYKDNRIRYLRHDKNRGLPNALNTGFAEASGDYLTWTSDDNYYLPEAIEKMVDFLKKNELVDLVYADYWAYYQDTGEKQLRKLPDKLNLRKENSVGACFLYTRRVYKDVGDYNAKYELVEDYDYWIRICSRYKSIRYPFPLYFYTEHSRSLKSTRHHQIVLLDGILKYRNNYISFSELGETLFQSFFGMLKSKRAKKETVIDCLRAILKVYNLSIFLGFLCSLSLVYSSLFKVVMVAKRHLLTGTLYLLEYIGFILSFKRKCSTLKITKDKINILCIVPFMVMGGAERAILNIARGVDQEKFSFHLVTTVPASNVWYNKFSPHFQNIVMPTKRVASENICSKYFSRLIRKLNIGIVLISNSEIGYKYLPQLKSEFQYVRTMDLLHAEQGPGATDKLAWVTPYLDRRICISNHLMEYMIKKYTVSGIGDRYVRRIKVIGNGIDLREYTPNTLIKGRFKSGHGISDDTRIVSFIGRFSSEKNPLLFVDIARRVIARSPNNALKFVMAGESSGWQFDEVRNAIDEYRIEKHFILAGLVDNIAELLADTYILLVTSKSEGIPFVVLEAMAMKIPVIGTDVGAMNEVIKNNINGILINPESNIEESFTCKIVDLLSGNQSHEALAEKTRETIVAKYSLEIMGGEYQSIFDELAGDDYDCGT